MPADPAPPPPAALADTAPPQEAPPPAAAPPASDWDLELGEIYETMREMSLQTDPQEMVRAYGRRMKRVFPTQRRVSLSRRDLEAPRYKVTRFSEWSEDINPWDEPDRTPVHSGGLLADLIYSDRPQVIDELDLDPADPAASYFEGCRSLLAIPLLDKGQALNMVVLGRTDPHGFARHNVPQHFWLANLFGRATQNLLLSSQLQAAYRHMDAEMKSVAKIQRSLLPKEPPEVPGISVGTYYATSERAGGDYYDFVPLPGGKVGYLIADVSGHGTPAAVVMAITHSIAHMYPGQTDDPGDFLAFLNEHLAGRYTSAIQGFVTAFYAVYDPATRRLSYATAGHNPPRVWRCMHKDSEGLNDGGNLPLGLTAGVAYPPGETSLNPGDRLVLYTDGIVEAANAAGELFGVERLDMLLREACNQSPKAIIEHITKAVGGFTGYAPADDDRTLVVLAAS